MKCRWRRSRSGHLFRDRLLHARGELETMFMGAETIRLQLRLIPDAEFVTRPRFSSLTNAGTCKLSRLPPRSAVVAFSAADVYSIAELVRRQRGGCLVLGALSPRTATLRVRCIRRGGRLSRRYRRYWDLNMHVDRVALPRRDSTAAARAADRGGNGADRRPRRPLHQGRQLRHDR